MIGEPEDSGTLFDAGRRSPTWKTTEGTRAPILPAPSAGDLFAAGREASRNDRSDFETQMLAEGYAPILDALGLDKSQNPVAFYHNRGTRNPILMRSELLARQGRGFMGAMTDRATQEQLLADEIRARRRTDPDFLKGTPDTVAGLRAMFAANEKARRAKGMATLERGEGLGGWAAGFAGSATQMITDPVNVATLPIGGGGGTIARIVLRETIVNGLIEAVQQPGVSENRKMIGEKLTLGEAAANIGIAGIAGGVLEGGLVATGRGIGAGYDKSIEALFNAMPEATQRAWADRMNVGIEVDGKVRRVKLTDLLEGMTNRDLAEAARQVVGVDRMTPEELAAAQVLDRDQEIGDSSPFEPGMAGDAEHQDRLAEAMEAVANGRLPGEGARVAADLQRAIDGVPAAARSGALDGSPGASVTAAFVAPVVTRGTSTAVAGADARQQFKARVRTAESGGNDAARNARSSAVGRYQFTDDTWLTYYKRRFGAAGASDAQILAKRSDGALQDQLMDDLTADNAAILRRAGAAETAGNLYLTHFLGPQATKLLKAAPDRPVEGLLPASFIDANRSVLAGKSASQVIAWAHRKMGGSAASIPPRGIGGELASAGDDAMVAQLRADALRLKGEAAGLLGETNIPGVGTVPLYSARLRPSDYGIDAARFQFKSGGDAEGVIDTLKGVTQWDPARSGRVLYWQDNDGRYWVADGHQRSGLAKRLEAQGAAIEVDGMVIREADGVSADDARSYGALLNILNRSADPVDAAKVLRGLGFDTDLGLPPNSALVRNANGLALLSDVAFGAVINGHLAPDMAAMIGRILPDDPDAHETMTNLLIRLDPANTGQAESIIRQALAAGMHREEQIDLFGSGERVSSLFLERAKILEKGLARLRGAKLAYSVAAREADTLERAGSTIARDASAREAEINAQAIEIIRRVAYSRNAVSDALNAAAERLASGGKLGDVVDGWVAAVRGIDLDQVARGADDVPARGIGDGGDFGDVEPVDEGGDLFAQPADRGQPELVELASPALDRFGGPASDGPASDGARLETDSLDHDLRNDLAADPDLGGRSFVVDGFEGPTALSDILARIDEDEAGAAALRGCL